MSASGTTKDRGYRLHDELADLLGQPRHQHGYRPTDLRCTVTDRDGEEQSAVLISTSNAGFRGIEGRFETYDGHVTLPLGNVVQWWRP